MAVEGLARQAGPPGQGGGAERGEHTLAYGPGQGLEGRLQEGLARPPSLLRVLAHPSSTRPPTRLALKTVQCVT